MEWNEIATHLCSAGMAALGGLWFYLKLFRGRRRNVVDAFTSMLGAALTGATSSLILCAYFCKDADSTSVVVGICGFAGLTGVSPVAMLKWLKVIVGQLPDEQPINDTKPGLQRIPDPPSDP